MGRQFSHQFPLRPARLRYGPLRDALLRIGQPKTWAIALILGAAVGLGACSSGPVSDPQEESEASLEDFEGDLVFEDVNLNRADDDGRPLWEVSAAEARYSRDRQKGQLKEPTGKLYQDGEVVYEVEADEGFVEQNGVILRLAGDIKIRDVRDDSTFESQKGKWQPNEGIFELEEGIVLIRESNRLTADSGQIFSQEQNFILKENVKLVSLEDEENPEAGKTELTADELTWQAEIDQVDAIGSAKLSQVDNNSQTTSVQANRLVWQREEQVIQGAGNVVAVSQSSGVRMQTQRAVLQQKKQLLSSDVPTVMEQYDCSSGSCVVGDRARGNRVDMNLADQVMFLRGDAQISLSDPALDASSQSMTWYLQNQRLIADQPVTVVNRTDGVVLQGNYGDVDMKSQVANLVGNVRGRSQQNQANMRSQRLFWAMKEQQVQLVGNVFYQQADPPLTSTGDRAAAAIDDGQFVLLSGPAV
ncbi:MAG: LPS export ABC transporter periplasmic protein LptC, partial [Cyanobacteria bacterium P01_H01_bin.130]